MITEQPFSCHIVFLTKQVSILSFSWVKRGVRFSPTSEVDGEGAHRMLNGGEAQHIRWGSPHPSG